MSQTTFSLFLAGFTTLLIACASQAAAPITPATSSAPTATPAATLAAAPAEPTWLLGQWLAKTGETPFGPMAMDMTFTREADGSFRGHTGDTPEQYIDLHLHRGPDGRLWLRESAALPGVGVQSHLLSPTDDTTGTRLRFQHAEHPAALEVLLEQKDERLLLAVVLRGKPHIRFELERMR